MRWLVIGEEALNKIEPGCAGRREVQMQARMLGEPRPHLGRLVRPVIVEHQMNVEVLLYAPVDPLQETDELLRPMARLALADNEATLDVERSEQRRRAVALVI